MDEMLEIVTDRERLVAALRERGVDYLTPSEAEGKPVSDEVLIASLAAHPDARLRQALIALFLLDPGLAPLAPRLRAQMPAPAVVELTAFYMAAVYLQCMWRMQLRRYLGEQSELPDYFSAELGLPPRADEQGKFGLYVLADWHQLAAQTRANQLSAYYGVADLLQQQLKLRSPRHEPAPAS